MTTNDPISDMLTRIRNGIQRARDEVRVPSTSLVLSIAETLKNEGFIKSFDIVKGAKTEAQNDVVIQLKYARNGQPAIRKLDRVSKPGQRIYRKVEELKPVLRGLGIWIVTTPKGVMSDKQARKAKVGGEVLCRVE